VGAVVEKQPAAFVVHGSTAAGLVWSMLARWGDPARPPAPGRYLWHGWWLVVADVVWPLPTDVEEAFATSDNAFVVAGAAGDVRAACVGAGVVEVRSVDVFEGPGMRSPAYLSDVPARLRRRRRRKGEAADLAPQLEALLAAWGWPVKRDIDPTRTLRGATSLDPWTGDNPDRHIVGERILCREMSRWALDLADPEVLGVELETGAVVHALWDRDNPPDPVQLWVLPKDWDASMPLPARLEWRRRETDVVREQCRLVGQRFWAAHRDRVVNPLFDTWLGALVHWHPDRRSSLFALVRPDQPASTLSLSGVGCDRLAPGDAQRFDSTVPAGLPTDVVLDDVATALRVASAQYPHALQDWEPVPDDVPRDLTATSRWAYERCSARLGQHT
jgi:hypothetical protein